MDREVRRMVEGEGCKPLRLEYGGKHRKLLFEYRGQQRTLIYSASPSDRRSRMNRRSVLRKIMRQIGGGDDQ